jgi:hypothetical protein
MTNPYLRAAAKFPKVKAQAVERLSKRPDRPVKPDKPEKPSGKKP